MKHFHTICPHCGCGCGLYIVEQDGKVSGATASQGHGLGRGQLCARGWTCYQLPGSTARLKAPMLGQPGQLSPATWNEAADSAAQMLKKARDKHGAESIGVIGSSRLTEAEAWGLRSLAEDVLKTPHFDTGARLGWVPLGLPNPGRYSDVEAADLIMVIGVDLLEENPILGARVMARCKPAADRPYVSPDLSHRIPDDPPPLMLATSRTSDLASASAVRIQPRPGREWVLLAAMLQKLVKADGCKAKGLDKLRESLAKAQIDKLVSHAGIAPDEVSRAGSLLEKASRPLLIVGRGLWQSDQAGFARAAVVDLALTAEKLKVMQAAAGANDAGTGLILISKAGMSYLEMMQAAASGKIKAMMLVGEDPYRSLPGDISAKALASLETLIVIDSFATNRAMAMAHAVLPMPLTLEKGGSFRDIEGSIQGFKAAAAAPTGVIGLSGILTIWAKALGGKICESGQAETTLISDLAGLDFPDTLAKDEGFLLELGTAYPHLAGGELLTEGTPHLAREFAGGWAELHPDDISDLGLRAGWRARFVTEAGKMELAVKANPGMLRKTIFMPVHFGANALAPMRYDRELKTPVLRGIPARVEKI